MRNDQAMRLLHWSLKLRLGLALAMSATMWLLVTLVS